MTERKVNLVRKSDRPQLPVRADEQWQLVNYGRVVRKPPERDLTVEQELQIEASAPGMRGNHYGQ